MIAFKAPKTNETISRASSVDGEGTKEGVLGRGGDAEGSKGGGVSRNEMVDALGMWCWTGPEG